MAEIKRKLAAIVFTDIVGFTKLSAENEPVALELLNRQREILKPIVDKYNGEWLKEIGDGLLLSFSTNREAVDCAIAIQNAVSNIDALVLRIGIHQGEVVFQGNDIVGDDVNIASRIEPFSAPGGIAISSRVNASLERDPEFDTLYLGKPSLKGVSQDIKAYCIVSHGLPKTELSDVRAKLEPEKSKGINWNIFNISGVVLTFIGIVFWINISFLGIGIAKDEEVPSIAILYMKNLGNVEDEAWTYGLTEDLIIEMSKKGLIRVSTMNAILKHKGSTLSEKEIAKDLDVKYVLTSSLHKLDDNFNLRCQLINTKNGVTVFGNKWTESTENSSLIVGNLADSLSSKINITSNRSKDIKNIKYKADPVAYEFYLKGKYKWEKKESAEDIEIAKDFLSEAIKLDSNLTKAQNKLAGIHSAQGDLKKSFKMRKNCLRIAKKLKNYEEIADSYRGIAYSYQGLRELDSAKFYFRKLLDLSNDIDYKEGIKSAYNGLAIVAYFMEEDETTFDYMGRALEIVRQLEDKKELPSALLNYATAYSIKGYFEKSYPLIAESIEVSSDISDKAALAQSYALMGGYLSIYGKYDEANTFLKKTRAIYKELNLKDAYADFSVGLSYNYFYAGYLDSAFMVLDDLYLLAKESQYQGVYSRAANLAGYLHYRNGDYKKALKNFTDYNESLGENNRGETRLNIYLFLALFNHYLGNENEFNKWAEISLKMIEDDNLLVRAPYNIIKIFEVYTIMNRNDDAKIILQEYYKYMLEIGSRIIDPEKRNAYMNKGFYHKQIMTELYKLGIS